MTRKEKEDLYDRICFLLADYEEDKRNVHKKHFYDLLREISIYWEFITGDDYE